MLRIGRQGCRGLCFLVALFAALASAPLRAQPMDAPAPVAAAAGPTQAAEAALVLNKRRIVLFRASLLGDTPSERAMLAQSALDAALEKDGPGKVARIGVGDAVRFELDGDTLFYLVADDFPGPRAGGMLDAAAQRVESRLNIAIAEHRESGDPRRIAIGAAFALLASTVAFALVRLLFGLRRLAKTRLDLKIEAWRRRYSDKHALGAYAGHLEAATRFTLTALTWGVVILVIDIWFTYVLNQFAYTRPWGERSTAWLLELLERFALAAIGAVPGLLTAVLIFVIARLTARAANAFMARVERGELKVGWLDADTAAPTRRLGNAAIWLFALAMAYPYLPGADSEAFKGVSVLAGLMLSLGASGVVGQAMSGMSLMYSRVLRVGEFVRVGEVEGTVTAIGIFTTKIHTGLGEEVSLPSSVVANQPVRNFSRLVQDGQFMLHTAVTIGYATPWRQVHAMLLEAAARTPGVAKDPAPYVMQTALSDFYVEYRLCAQGDRGAPRRRAEAINRLHGNIQDVFNEHGVQIMSPHYIADPAEPQVVPPGTPWAPPAAVPTPAPKDGPSP
jgi:small-conductance mechanosensitive channel